MALPFALAHGLTPEQFGVTPQVALSAGTGEHEAALRDFRRFRRQQRDEMTERAAKRGMRGYNDLLEECAARMANPATDKVRSLAQNHWISRILDTASTYGGNIGL